MIPVPKAVLVLTKLELAVLRAIDKSEYGDSIYDETWTFSVQDNIEAGVSARSIPGAVSSLSKKGLVRIGGSGKEATIGFTKDGVAAYCAAVGSERKKWIDETDLAARQAARS